MKRVLLITLATLSIWSCSKDSDIDYAGAAPGTDYDPQQVVCFTTDTNAETRGTPITDQNVLTEFTTIGTFGYSTGQNSWSETTSLPNRMFNKKLTRGSKGWVYDGGAAKWDNTQASDKFTFFAYAPYAETSNGITVNGNASTVGAPTLTYTVPSDVTKQPDLMVAVSRMDIVKPDNGFVSLDMKHALTCVGFQVAGAGEKIKSIAITGVSMTGTLAVDGNVAVGDGGPIKWTNLGTATTSDFTASINFDDDPMNPGGKLTYFTATEDMSGTGTRPDFLAGNGYLMMIPQALGEDAKIVLTMSNDTTTEIGLNGYSWTAGKRVNYIISLVDGGSITVEPERLLFPPSASKHSISVLCQDKNGDPDPNLAWTLTTSESWLTLSLNSDGTGAAQTLSSTGSKTVYVFASANTSTTTNRTTTITLDGTTNIVTTATQIYEVTDGGNAVDILTYVGAFWRADQRAERLISIPVTSESYAGNWAVQVLDYGDFSEGDITFAPWDGNHATLNTGDPDNGTEDYYVSGNATYLTGTAANGEKIAFKVGLKQTIGATSHRYGRIVLSFGSGNYNYHRVIYLRQGEAEDWLMRETDNNTAGNITTDWGGTASAPRPRVAKFSPYNLTAPSYRADGGASSIESYNVGYQGGTMTEYPSQAGAFFQWAHTNGAYAFHPTLPNDATTPNGFGKTNTVTTWWDDGLESTYETCPDGYRRPTSGPTNDHHTSTTPAVSEMTQSLWIDPQNDRVASLTNLVWGYYADGFFDRREITYQTAYSGDDETGTAVATNTSTVAFVGQLFYNKFNNASLFFPAPGYRNRNGYLYDPGMEGRYWSSSSHSLTYGWFIYLTDSYIANEYNTYRQSGFSVRCVAE